MKGVAYKPIPARPRRGSTCRQALALLLVLGSTAAMAGCGLLSDEPSEEERLRWNEAGQRLVGRWDNGVRRPSNANPRHEWQFCADGSFQHEQIFSDDGSFVTYEKDAGPWSVTGLHAEGVEVHISAQGRVDNFGMPVPSAGWTLLINFDGSDMLLGYRFSSNPPIRLKSAADEQTDDEGIC